MRNSLIFKLMGAFILVVAIGSFLIYFLTSQATQSAFNLYSTRSGQAWAQRLAPALADYYAQNNSWQGADTVIQSGITLPGSTTGMGGMMGRGMGLGAQAGGGMWGMMGQRVILADSQGIVVSDTEGQWVGKQFLANDLTNGTAILVNNQQVGTIFVTPNDLANSGTPAGQFLASVNQAIFSSALIAGGIAILLAALLFFQITSPLRQLKKAAAAIANGDLTQRVTIRSRDEFGELSQTFNTMAENLSSAETQRQHLMADVAHELRTPLAALQGTIEGIQDGVLPLDEEQVTALYTETMLLNRLVGDLRLLSLAEAGALKLERQETDLGILLSQTVDRFKLQAQQKEVDLQAKFDSQLPLVFIDSDRIAQVLNNLISNSLRYTPQGGTITVSASRISHPMNVVQVSVTDTGSGIDPNALPFVFDRFYRGDKSRTRSSGGSGLGLAIVKQLVEAHSGSIKVESPIFTPTLQAGSGTRFIFTLPSG